MVLSRLFRRGTSSSNLVGQVEFLILLLIVTLIVALLARRLRVPYTLLLVIVGLVIGLLPFLPDIHIDPNLVLYVFLPALLFKGAWNAEIDRLEADWLAIVLLVVPGMVLSLLVVAVALSWGIGFEWLRSLTCFSSSACPIA
jgi:CPA1 family monovalent cation:H+ antiporter